MRYDFSKLNFTLKMGRFPSEIACFRIHHFLGMFFNFMPFLFEFFIYTVLFTIFHMHFSVLALFEGFIFLTKVWEYWYQF